MKKVFCLLLCLLMLLCLAACGGDVSDEPMITRSAEDTGRDSLDGNEEPSDSGEAGDVPAGDYVFYAGDVRLVPGEPFDPSVLPEADSVYQVPSCAIEGTDNLYNYGTFELTAFDDGTGEVIYSILLTDPNLTTTEGLALGDSVTRAVELYGEGYTQQGTAYVYTGQTAELYIIIQGDTVASIEYRMIVK